MPIDDRINAKLIENREGHYIDIGLNEQMLDSWKGKDKDKDSLATAHSSRNEEINAKLIENQKEHSGQLSNMIDCIINTQKEIVTPIQDEKQEPEMIIGMDDGKVGGDISMVCVIDPAVELKKYEEFSKKHSFFHKRMMLKQCAQKCEYCIKLFSRMCYYLCKNHHLSGYDELRFSIPRFYITKDQKEVLEFFYKLNHVFDTKKDLNYDKKINNSRNLVISMLTICENDDINDDFVYDECISYPVGFAESVNKEYKYYIKRLVFRTCVGKYDGRLKYDVRLEHGDTSDE